MLVIVRVNDVKSLSINACQTNNQIDYCTGTVSTEGKSRIINEISRLYLEIYSSVHESLLKVLGRNSEIMTNRLIESLRGKAGTARQLAKA